MKAMSKHFFQRDVSPFSLLYTHTHTHTHTSYLFGCSGSSCGKWDLVPSGGMELGPPALGAWSLSHWTSREGLFFLSLQAVSVSLRTNP